MQGQAKDAAESYLNWWALAGVDYLYRDEVMPFLTPPEPLLHTETRADSAPAPVAAVPQQAAAQSFDAATLPDNLQDFHRWLSNSPALPGAGWSAHRVLPRGIAQSGLMVISDFPDGADIEQQTLFSGGPGKLLSAMLGAIGIPLEQVMLTPLCFTRPPGGRLDPQAERDLVAIARHHIALAQPKTLLVLGDRTSRALIGMDMREGRSWLRSVNHFHGSVDAVITFHPRFLLERPQYKRAAWDDLKLLRKELGKNHA